MAPGHASILRLLEQVANHTAPSAAHRRQLGADEPRAIQVEEGLRLLVRPGDDAGRIGEQDRFGERVDEVAEARLLLRQPIERQSAIGRVAKGHEPVEIAAAADVHHPHLDEATTTVGPQELSFPRLWSSPGQTERLPEEFLHRRAKEFGGRWIRVPDPLSDIEGQHAVGVRGRCEFEDARGRPAVFWIEIGDGGPEEAGDLVERLRSTHEPSRLMRWIDHQGRHRDDPCVVSRGGILQDINDPQLGAVTERPPEEGLGSLDDDPRARTIPGDEETERNIVERIEPRGFHTHRVTRYSLDRIGVHHRSALHREVLRRFNHTGSSPDTPSRG